jgi:hypothetical protein
MGTVASWSLTLFLILIKKYLMLGAGASRL